MVVAPKRLSPSGQGKKKSNAAFALFFVACFAFGFFFVSKPSPPEARVRSTKTAENKLRTSQNAVESQSDAQPGIQSSVTENWRGAPVGDGEDTVDSYHSHDHRPNSNDPRDVLLKEYPIYPCPNNGVGTMVSGQDFRYHENNDKNYKERNPKFLCDVNKLTQDPIQPCVIYSFGSYGEVSFEVGIDQVTNSGCKVHTFDPARLPPQTVAEKYHFSIHDMGISEADNGKFKTLGTVMSELGHSHIHVFKIDVEGHEKESLPQILKSGVFDKIDQIAIEFHSVDLMRQGMNILKGAGFGMVFARREDRCDKCTEVTMVKMNQSTQ